MAGDPRAFAANYKDGKSLQQSMLEAGYSPSHAKRGMASVSKKMLKALAAEGFKLADFGKSLSLDTLKHIAIGRLATNAITGKDGGALSAKIIGSHRDLNLWIPESQTGVIVIGNPSLGMEDRSKKLLQETSEQSK